ncbi:MAG TPA: hypothetical protein VL096_08120 [Pirellulaceae bacterium]|nr:hypothetical protein [Pirellulaceae bacterium]
MKQILTVLTLAVFGFCAATWAVGQGSAPASDASAITPAARPQTAERTGQELLVQATQELTQLPSLDAKLRLTTNLLGKELVGSGSYYQLVRENETLLKLELKMQVAQQVSSLLQVSDGRFLWVRRDLPQKKSLSRIDQRRVREAIAQAPAIPVAHLQSSWMALGGLGKLLQALENSFQFSPAVAGQLRGVDVWTLEGTWRPNKLAELWPDQAPALLAGQTVDLAKLPTQLPERVQVVLSRDPAIPLFPYRIEYQRRGRAGEFEPMVTLELFEIRRNVALDPRLFAYKPGDQEVADETELYLARLGLK